ncbi:carboxymuconolactone decarboxylase family protein [Actinomadura flavalba]|uniref:carboxymuconolactone decarboxylase family protein n=1 Tax=Actinomadura flavalba TaxID=1120938 RepID=UPI000374C6B4|nr:carboxymuconolactone decarboxylase family protein [Actinomadura flavalba]
MSAEQPIPARIPPLPEAEWDDFLQAVASSTGKLHVFSTLGRHPALFQAWIGFASQLLMRGSLSARDRELAILRTAHLRACAYEWSHHRSLALDAGLTDEHLAALREPLDAYPWDAADRVVLTTTDELHATGTVGDATWAAITGRFSDTEAIELIMLIGNYQMTAFTLNALRVQDETGEHP